MPHPDTPCDNCAAPCCRNYQVVIDGGDAFRLAETLKTPMQDFCELRWIEREEGGYRILLDGRADAEPRFHRLVLRKVPDPDPQYTERCIFLVSVGPRGRCGVHAIRPGACSIYPTRHHDGLLTLDGGGAYCPPDAWQLELVDVPGFRLRHLRRDRATALWNAFVDGWNERVRHDGIELGEATFLAFIGNVYRELAVRHPLVLNGDPADAGASPPPRAAADEILRALGFRTDETAGLRRTGAP